MTSFLNILAADPAPAPNPLRDMAIPMILIFVMFYFLIIRPQKKRQAAMKEQMSALKTGDKIITAGGIHGMVTNVKETSAMVKIADNVKVEFEKASIVTVVKKDGTTIDNKDTAPPLEGATS
jgi:preprotein translocase subunit YajC